MKDITTLLFGTLGRTDCVRDMLDSIEEFTDPELYEVVLVDSSTNSEVQDVIKGRPNVVRVAPGGGSYSRSFNKGAREAKGRRLAWLNDDCLILRSGWLNEVVDFMHQNPTLGAVGIPFIENGVHQRGYWQKLYYANFGCTYTHLWHAMQGLDERFNSYGAEADFCVRLWEKRRKVVEVPGEPMMKHLEHPSHRETLEPHRVPGFHLHCKLWPKRRMEPILKWATAECQNG